MELVRYLSTLKQGQTTLAEINHNRNCEEKSFEYADNGICDVNFPLKQSTTFLGASKNKKSFAAYSTQHCSRLQKGLVEKGPPKMFSPSPKV